MSYKNVIVTARVRAKSGQQAALRDLLVAMLGPSRAEPGCRRFELLQGADDDRAFVSIETWASRGDLDRHLQMPYIRDFMEKSAQLLDGPPEMQFWDIPQGEPEVPTDEETHMDSSDKNLISAVETLARRVGVPLDKIAAHFGGSSGGSPGGGGQGHYSEDVPEGAYGVPDQDTHPAEILVRYTVGWGCTTRNRTLARSTAPCTR